MNNNYQIIELTAETADKYWQLRYECFTQHRRPTDINYSDSQHCRERLLANREERKLFCFMVFSSDELQAIFGFRTGLEEGQPHLYSQITCVQNQCSGELLSAILSFLNNRESEEYTVHIKINARLEEQQISRFRLKTRVAISTFLANRNDICFNPLNQWRQDAEKQNTGLRIEFHTELPEVVIDEYAEIFNSFWADLPTIDVSLAKNITAEDLRQEQISHQEKGNLVYRWLVFNEENRLVAQTYLEIYKVAPEYIYQCMTGVIKEYRGRGIGKWLKSIMYPMILEKHPEIKGIVTDMQESNSYIQNINRQIGFQPINVGGEYIMNREEFAKWRE